MSNFGPSTTFDKFPMVSSHDAAIPDAETLGRLIAPASPRHRSVQQLHALLVACKPGDSATERVDAFEQLSRWLQWGRGVVTPPRSEPGDTPQVQRLRLLLEALRMSPPLGHRVAFTLSRVLDDSVGGTLFARLGLPTDRGFLAETIDRISRRYLPEPRDDRDLLQFVARLFPSKGSLRILSATPPELARDLTMVLRGANREVDPWVPLHGHVIDASALLSTRVSALGLSDVLRARSPKVPLTESPFFKLPRAVDALVDAIRHQEDVRARANECRALIQDCRRVSEIVVENLERYGVSVDVVYRIELLGRSLTRLSALILQLEPCSDLERASAAKALLVELVGLRLRDRQIGDIIRGNLHLLARKIIERAGHTGEHYITSTTGEYVKMLASAGGGGVLTVGTTALKFIVGWGHFAPFVEGVLAASNYSASFILMQLLGFTLATKQPSMTAAALAGTLRESAGHPDLSALVAMIARITRSQLAAAIGNIGLVIPSAFAFDLLWRAQHGKPFLDEATAHYVVHSLHPTQTGTIFFAALTGVLLWMSSIVAGWIENWAVYRRLPEAIADHRLGRIVGRGTMSWLSHFFLRNVSGFGGNTALGFMLGMTPVMGKFFGLPLDVRHVTLSTGALTLSVLALGSEALETTDVWAAALGIAIIGSLNFGVSFVLALLVALRARQVNRSDRFRLLLSVLATFLRSPVQFFVPPRRAATPRVHGPVSVPPPARH
jgi:site-specific recombinase